MSRISPMKNPLQVTLMSLLHVVYLKGIISRLLGVGYWSLINSTFMS